MQSTATWPSAGELASHCHMHEQLQQRSRARARIVAIAIELEPWPSALALARGQADPIDISSLNRPAHAHVRERTIVEILLKSVAVSE
jgi:hypothetical protein